MQLHHTWRIGIADFAAGAEGTWFGRRPKLTKRQAREALKRVAAGAEALRPIITPLIDLPAYRIAEALNERNVPTARDGKWHANSVARVVARLGLAR